MVKPLFINSPISALFTGLACLLLLSCSSMKEPEFRAMGNLKLKKFGFEHSSLTMDLSYFNPNKSGLKLKNAEGDAWADDEFLGHFIIDTMVNIPPESVFDIPVKLNIETRIFFKTSLASFTSQEIKIRLEGKAKVGKGNFFIHYPIRYEGSQRLSKILGYN